YEYEYEYGLRNADDVVVALASAQHQQPSVDQVARLHARLHRRGAERDAVDGDAAGAELAPRIRLRRAGADLRQQVDDQRALPVQAGARRGDGRRRRQRPVQQVAADAAQVAATEQRLGRAQDARQRGLAVDAAGEILRKRALPVALGARRRVQRFDLLA